MSKNKHDYNKDFEQMEARGEIDRVDAEVHEWKQVGESIIGLLTEIEEVESSKGDGTYMRYTFDTNDGLINCALGKKYNKLITDSNVGMVYRITYAGKLQTAGKNTLNDFKIECGAYKK